MGFKCPMCKKDFGNKKEEFEKHIEKCNYGMAGNFVKNIREICEKKSTKELAEEGYQELVEVRNDSKRS